MIHLNLDREGSEGLQILSLGSPANDSAICCGGTILCLAEQYPGCVFHWVVFSTIRVREAEARHAASLPSVPAEDALPYGGLSLPAHQALVHGGALSLPHVVARDGMQCS